MKKSNIVSSILQQSKTFIHVWKYRKSNTEPRPNPSNKLDRMMRVSKIPPTTDSFFTRRVDPSQKSLSFVSQSVLHAEKVPFATVSFSLYFNESPGDPLLRIYIYAKFLIIFSLRGNRPVLEDVNSRCKFYAPHGAPCKSDSSSRVPSIQFFNFYTPLLKLEHRL